MGKLAGTWPPRPPWRLISTILIGRDAALTHAKLPVLVHLDGTIACNATYFRGMYRRRLPAPHIKSTPTHCL